MARYIDADALEQQFNEERRLFAEQDMKGAEHVLVHSALMLLREAPIIDAVPRWIPCEERLPEKDGYYLVTHQWQIFKDEYEINIDEYRHGEWVETPRSCMTVAWMPLPEPYKGERKDDETN